MGIAGAQARTPRVGKPNIIFIMADDLGYADLGCYGQKRIQTPNLDRMAAEGLRFTQAYSGSTVCAPSRCCLMTGMHTGHARVRGNVTPHLPLRPQDTTVAEVLKKAGYSTGMFGKWGLGPAETSGIPNKKGFDEWYGYLDQVHAHNYYTDVLWDNRDEVALARNQGGQKKLYTHDLFTERGLKFIEKHREDPFFLYMAYTIPHSRWEVPSDEPYSNQPWTENQKNLAAMITRLDRDVGRILDLLKKNGLDENTLVMFTSDNGPVPMSTKFFASSQPLRGSKRDLYEGGIRVPLIARWPGKVAAGKTSDQVLASWDMLPTFAELAGVRPSAGIDGISMAPALLGKTQRKHEYLYWEFFEAGFQQAVRVGDWKGVRLAPGKSLELYDLRTDLAETNDIAAKHPDVVANIERILKTARTESEFWPQRRTVRKDV